jgi:ketosteroid isomerase-like protein
MEHRACDQLAEQTVVLIKSGYGAFNRRDVDGALAAMAPDVDWENGLEGGRLHGHREVRAYWMRQWEQLDVFAAPRAFTVDDEGRVVVLVDQQVRRADGALVSAGEIHHVLTMRDGLVARMDIEQIES